MSTFNFYFTPRLKIYPHFRLYSINFFILTIPITLTIFTTLITFIVISLLKQESADKQPSLLSDSCYIVVFINTCSRTPCQKMGNKSFKLQRGAGALNYSG